MNSRQSVGSSSDIKNWTDFQITWFENNDPEDVIEGSFENKPPYRPKVKFIQDRKERAFKFRYLIVIVKC